MNVTIFGATGPVGKQLITHSLAKGWKVRAFGRNVTNLIDDDLRNDNFEVIKGYVFDEDEVFKAVQHADGVLSALGGSLDGTDRARSLGLKNIVRQMENAQVNRIVALGGLGVLPGANMKYLVDEEDYPEAFVPVGREHIAAYETLLASPLNWTFIASPNIIDANADNRFEVVSEKTASGIQINSGNLALFMVDELERKQFEKQRVGIANL